MGHAREIYEGLGLSAARAARVLHCPAWLQHRSLASPPSPGTGVRAAGWSDSSKKNAPACMSWLVGLAGVVTLCLPSLCRGSPSFFTPWVWQCRGPPSPCPLHGAVAVVLPWWWHPVARLSPRPRQQGAASSLRTQLSGDCRSRSRGARTTINPQADKSCWEMEVLPLRGAQSHSPAGSFR